MVEGRKALSSGAFPLAFAPNPPRLDTAGSVFGNVFLYPVTPPGSLSERGNARRMRFLGQQRRSSLEEVELDTLLGEGGTFTPRSSPRKTVYRLRIPLALLCFLLLCSWTLLSFDSTEGATGNHRNGSNVDDFQTFNISSPDGSAHASFIGAFATRGSVDKD